MEAPELNQKSIKEIQIQKVYGNTNVITNDILSIEEPLEISIEYGANEMRLQKNISITMRTPGNDEELAIGFLFTEGIINSIEQIKSVTSKCENKILVKVEDAVSLQLKNTDRNFYTTSSCGVCGKSSIDAIKTVSIYQNAEKDILNIDLETIYHLPIELKTAQEDFLSTGGIHASGLFTTQGNLLYLREDVGRHNALDKLIGHAVINQQLPLDKHILLLSGRASFELIQKASMAGIRFIVAIGAPSSLAVSLAKEFDITLIGFLKENKFNLYHLSKHIHLNNLNYENQN